MHRPSSLVSHQELGKPENYSQAQARDRVHLLNYTESILYLYSLHIYAIHNSTIARERKRYASVSSRIVQWIKTIPKTQRSPERIYNVSAFGRRREFDQNKKKHIEREQHSIGELNLAKNIFRREENSWILKRQVEYKYCKASKRKSAHRKIVHSCVFCVYWERNLAEKWFGI